MPSKIFAFYLRPAFPSWRRGAGEWLGTVPPRPRARCPGPWGLLVMALGSSYRQGKRRRKPDRPVPGGFCLGQGPSLSPSPTHICLHVPPSSCWVGASEHLEGAATVNSLPREPRVGFVFLARGGHSVSSSAGDRLGPAGCPLCRGCSCVPIWAREIISSQSGRPLLEMAWLPPGARRTVGVDLLPHPNCATAPSCPIGSSERETVGARRLGLGNVSFRGHMEETIVTFRVAGHFVDQQFLLANSHC